MLLAYFGPDAVMPVASSVAAVMGVVLMFGRQAAGAAVLAVRWPGAWKRRAGWSRRDDLSLRVDRLAAARAHRREVQPSGVES